MQASELLMRLKAALGAPAEDPRFEGIVAGAPATEVTGVATCSAPSIEVLRRAAAARCNFVLADLHPLYTYDQVWAGLPGTAEGIAKSPVAKAKTALIDGQRLVVARLPTAWTVKMPAAGAAALAEAIGVADARPAPGGGAFVVADVPRTSFVALARSVATRARIDGLRLSGASATPVTRVAVANGLLSPKRMGQMLADPKVDALVCGEVNEWEAGPYFQDVVAMGRACGLLQIGFDASQEPLAGVLAGWVRPLAAGLTVRPLTQSDPIRTVAAGAQ